jgi:hypothetical protein
MNSCPLTQFALKPIGIFLTKKDSISKGPNFEQPNFEPGPTSKDSTSKRTQLRKGLNFERPNFATTQLRKGLNFEKDPTSKLNSEFELRKSIGLNFKKDPTSKLNFEFELRKTIYS